jgi:hypothetical protein
MLMKKRHYKMRAECLIDVLNLLTLFDYEHYKIPCGFVISKEHDFPDVELELTIGLDFRKLLEIIEQVEDGHVMFRTVALKGNYTGEYLRFEKTR